eukprot:GHVU01110026.1.p1 GENE.GHVU01110026.1~~GHVU01110026.1.p1  ORF type:complete len:101 (-),score=6.16 GHVU01110026.1:150-452(-)
MDRQIDGYIYYIYIYIYIYIERAVDGRIDGPANHTRDSADPPPHTHRHTHTHATNTFPPFRHSPCSHADTRTNTRTHEHTLTIELEREHAHIFAGRATHD